MNSGLKHKLPEVVVQQIKVKAQEEQSISNSQRGVRQSRNIRSSGRSDYNLGSLFKSQNKKSVDQSERKYKMEEMNANTDQNIEIKK